MKIKFIDVRSLIRKRLLILIMRTFIFLLCTTFFGFNSIEGLAQEKVIINTDKEVSVHQVFRIIKKQTKYRFLYPESLFIDAPKVQLKKGVIELSKLLKQALSGSNVKFELSKGNTIVIEEESSFKKSNKKQQIKVSGAVMGINGQPLPGANILEKGTTNGIQTDFDGKFSLTVSSEESILVISYIGFVTKEVIAANEPITVTLVEDAAELEEIVVIGYGSQKKTTVTDAVSTVKMNEVLGNRPISDVRVALQATAPGLQITSNSGQPGAQGLGVQLRGFPSINGGGSLILQDNVPVNFSDINPQDIETITVLKDASASAIYGARAAFGVVLITTKKPTKKQKVKFDYSSTLSVNTAHELVEKASTYQFVKAMNDFGQQSYWTGQLIPEWLGFLEDYSTNPSAYPDGIAIDATGRNYPLRDTDIIGSWMGNTGWSQFHNFSFSGGSEKTTFRVSAGYSDEDGILVTDNDSYKKITLNAFLQTDLTKNLTTSTNVLYTNSDRNRTRGSYGRSIDYVPFAFEGLHFFNDGRSLPYLTPENQERYEPADNQLIDNIRFFQKFVYNPIKDLKLTGEYTFEKRNVDDYGSNIQQDYIHPVSLAFFEGDPLLTAYSKNNFKSIRNSINVFANYDKKIGKHNFGATVGLNREVYDAEGFNIRRTNLISTGLPSISGATGEITGGDSFSNWAVLGYFGRITYNYKEKYLLKLSGRYDGSSRFREGNRFGWFPSLSAGWVVSNEKFMNNINFLSQLKLRATIGEIGNQNTNGLYPYLPLMDPYRVDWLNEDSGVRYVSVGSPNLVSQGFTWETVQSKGIGIDLALFNNKLTASFDFFERNTLDMIRSGAQLPAVLGTNAPTENAADLQTRGWEFEMKWRQNVGDFSYNIGFNLWDNQTKITKFDNPGFLLNDFYVGRKIGEIWGYATDGYYTVDDFEPGTLSATLENGTLKEGVVSIQGVQVNPGDIKYKDLNGDGIINSGNNTLITELDENGEMVPNTGPGDRKIIGNSSRRFQFGIIGGASYKNFDLSFVLNGVGKREVWQNSGVIFPFQGQFNTIFKHQLDYWTPDNTNAYFPRIYENGNYGKSRRTQTKYLLDGSYLRIKNIALGYSLPNNVLEKIKIDKLRLFISGENLFTFDNLPKGVNTELQNKGGGASYPFLRSYNFGINLSF
ncbi:TonB-dependent receptor [uncultured Wocania sp.]|uniref:SusC/RagA family TonB-linked outer membrane protein n=1 Tax=uncultured Wocania sp. TaxID=2834404 RepID=UPI0030F73521